jgi:hypothetical protein
MRRGLPLIVLLASACLGGSASFDLPDRSDPAVQQKEAALVGVLSEDRSGRVLGQGPGPCKVRLLRSVGDTDYVWARCEIPQGEGVSAPFRVRGRVIDRPGDGSVYEPSLRRLFPHDIAEALLADSSRYQP